MIQVFYCIASKMGILSFVGQIHFYIAGRLLTSYVPGASWLTFPSFSFFVFKAELITVTASEVRIKWAVAWDVSAQAPGTF